MDAMRSDYISKTNTPFLWKCSKEGEYYKKVIPHFGYCERTEIFTGQTPEESGYFTAIGYDPGNSPFRNVRFLNVLGSLEEFVPKNIKLFGLNDKGLGYRIFRKLVNRWIIRETNGISGQQIPIQLLKYWNLTEDKIDHRDIKAFQVPSIFSLLTNENKSFYYDSFTALNLPSSGSDTDRMEMVMKDKILNNNNFYLVYISLPDYYGHNFGPESVETKNALLTLDCNLKKYTSKLLNIDPNCNFIYLGDHGMAAVNIYFNAEIEILEIARKCQLKLKKDFIYFLDSTLVRLWFFSEKAKTIFKNNLENSIEFLNNGIFINDEIAKKEKIPLMDERYGDLIWWANTGTLVFPDYFHRVKKYKGMHGYDPQKIENQGTCIIYGKEINYKEVESIHLTDVFDILKKTLKIDKYRG